MKRIEVPNGSRFGLLTTLSEATPPGRPRRFACRCDCGVELVASLTHLRSGHTRSCGCAKRATSVRCSATACDRAARRNGLCNAHDLRQRQGSSLAETAPVRELDLTGERRLRERVRREGDCILWLGSLNHSGYGSLRINGRWTGVHRIAYELTVGPIPEGLEIDHLCSVRNCVNPEHLEPVTHDENLRRARERRAG